MATILVSSINYNASQIDTVDSPSASISDIAKTVDIEDLSIKAIDIDAVDYPEFSITSGNRMSVINEVLPFRVRFTNLTVPQVSFADVPGIGLQIIGFNNYIL
jgi:hypothetical protein